MIVHPLFADKSICSSRQRRRTALLQSTSHPGRLHHVTRTGSHRHPRNLLSTLLVKRELTEKGPFPQPIVICLSQAMNARVATRKAILPAKDLQARQRLTPHSLPMPVERVLLRVRPPMETVEMRLGRRRGFVCNGRGRRWLRS